MSSASNPGSSHTGTAKAAISSFTRSNCPRSSGGAGGRCALYSGNRRCRKVGVGVSNATTICEGCHSLTARRNTLANPYTPVTSSPLPDRVRLRLTLMARKARCTIAWPSISSSSGRPPLPAPSPFPSQDIGIDIWLVLAIPRYLRPLSIRPMRFQSNPAVPAGSTCRRIIHGIRPARPATARRILPASILTCRPRCR